MTKGAIRSFGLLALMVFLPAVSRVWAQTTATPAPAAPAVAFGGLVDTYYLYNFTDATNASTGKAVSGYFYNSINNSYSMGLAEARLTATQGQAGAHLVLAYGQETGLCLWSPGNSGIDVLQAYLSYNPGPIAFSAGRFVTWMGYEVVESTGNWNYSHSLLFDAVPLWHTGFSVNAAPSPRLGVTGYVVDSCNSFVSTPLGKTYGLEAAWTPHPAWSLTLNGILFPYTPAQNCLTGEAILAYKPSAWNFAVDVEYACYSAASGTAPDYWGVALYGRYQAQSDWAVALRLEYLNDENNDAVALAEGANLYGNAELTGHAFIGAEATLTVEHDFTANLVSRLEARVDVAGYNGYYADVFADGGSGSSDQVTGTASMAMMF